MASRLKQEGIISVHHETIYQYIVADKKAGGTLYQRLRHQAKRYRKRYGSAPNRSGIPNRVDIDQRPEAANNRERVGDWEVDTIIGKHHQGAIVTLDDRKSKLCLISHCKLNRLIQPYLVTITWLINCYHFRQMLFPKRASRSDLVGCPKMPHSSHAELSWIAAQRNKTRLAYLRGFGLPF